MLSKKKYNISMLPNKKSSIILILKVLEEYSDEEHYLTQQAIINLINEEYGVELERKSIASSISILNDLGYDVVKAPKGGYALLSRTLEPSEISFLVDAVFSSKSISGKNALELTSKISSGLSKYQRKDYKYLLKSSEVSRTSNAEVFYTIDVILEAVRRNKWVMFNYVGYNDEGKEELRFGGSFFKVSPCYLINNFGRYYLQAYRNKYNSVNTYRVDYIKNIEIIEDRERLDPKTLDEFKGYKSISDYINDHVYMFGGKTIECKMLLNEPYVAQYIFDWFGNNAEVKKENDVLIAKVKCNENALFYWVMQYGEHLKVIEPEEIIKRIKDAGKQIQEKYK